MANVRMRVSDLRRVFREAAGFEPVDSWADELDDGRPLRASRFNVDVTCVSCGKTAATEDAEATGWEHSYLDQDWRCPRCLREVNSVWGKAHEAHDMCDENDDCGMNEADDDLVSREEIEQWVKQQPMQDITGKPDLRAFDRRLSVITRGRELSDGALEALYDAYPKAMAAFEYQRPSIKETAPRGKGWERVVKGLKKAKNVDNPFALAHSMKNKGMKPREQK